MNIISSSIKWNSKLGKRSNTTMIILHHAAASICSVDDIDSWHKQRGWAGIGYHFLVRKDGSVYEGRPIDTVGAHVVNYNSNSVGICAEGNFESDIMTDSQKKSMKELIEYVKGKYPNVQIVAHNELASTKCPGKNFPLEEFRNSTYLASTKKSQVQDNDKYTPANIKTSPYYEKGIKVTVTSLFGSRNGSFHYGVDLVGPVGTPICSVLNGTVERAQYQDAKNSKVGYGLYVWVKNDDGTGCIYAHLSKLEKGILKGTKVSAGQIIGYQGHTGSVRSSKGGTGEHLHFGYSSSGSYTTTHKKKSNFIDPATFFGVTFKKGMVISNDKLGVENPQYTPAASTADDSSSSSNSSVPQSNQNVTQLVPSGTYYRVTEEISDIQDILFGRRYRCIIDCGNEAFDVSELRCKFEIVKSARVEVCSSSITIYNLNPDTENKIIKEGKRIIIEAGYAGAQYGKIFSGNIIQPLRSKENSVDYCLTLVSMDSDQYVSYGLVGVAITAKQSSRDAITACINKAGELTGNNYFQEEGYICNTSITYPRGKVMFGKAAQLLSQIAKSENATYYNESGEVNIVRMDDYPQYEIVSLTPKSGLVGNPTQTADGISFSCLINPAIRIDSFVKLDNRTIANYQYQQGSPVRSLDDEGIYRVVKMQISGDTRGSGSSWVMNCDAIAQSTLLPGMVAGSDIYKF